MKDYEDRVFVMTPEHYISLYKEDFFNKYKFIHKGEYRSYPEVEFERGSEKIHTYESPYETLEICSFDSNLIFVFKNVELKNLFLLST